MSLKFRVGQVAKLTNLIRFFSRLEFYLVGYFEIWKLANLIH